MRAKLISAISVTLLAIAIGGYWYTQVRPENEAKDAVRQLLTDPASAQFRNVERNAKTGLWCGEVNSKNKLGGYVGFSKFVVKPDKTAQLSPNDQPMPDKASEIIVHAGEVLDFIRLVQEQCPKVSPK